MHFLKVKAFKHMTVYIIKTFWPNAFPTALEVKLDVLNLYLASSICYQAAKKHPNTRCNTIWHQPPYYSHGVKKSVYLFQPIHMYSLMCESQMLTFKLNLPTAAEVTQFTVSICLLSNYPPYLSGKTGMTIVTQIYQDFILKHRFLAILLAMLLDVEKLNLSLYYLDFSVLS